jgi:hypothetical protein
MVIRAHRALIIGKEMQHSKPHGTFGLGSNSGHMTPSNGLY